ncbi:formylmethanofuran--tetrahydromethanopterin N-formyltransferase [Candidatus Bathyarchaeota archaeon]|nr:formylmethanofuran--tetrahydromethanopterin N-formyltransferase [Candidatus Bathyarchaeota archaeon]
MKINNVEIDDTFAEIWDLKIARILVTAYSESWALSASQMMAGYGSSVIMCASQAGIEGPVSPIETPDGRPGVLVQVSLPPDPPYNGGKLKKEIVTRTLTLIQPPTCAAFNAMPKELIRETVDVGSQISRFGDGFESEDVISDREVYRIPVTSGDFIVEKKFGITVGCDGHFIVMAENVVAGLAGVNAAFSAIRTVGGVAPLGLGPSNSAKRGGINYKERATTSHAYVPSLRNKVKDTNVPEGVEAVMEVAFFGLTMDAVKKALKVGIEATTTVPGVKKISALDLGGTFGGHQIYFRDLF